MNDALESVHAGKKVPVHSRVRRLENVDTNIRVRRIASGIRNCEPMNLLFAPHLCAVSDDRHATFETLPTALLYE